MENNNNIYPAGTPISPNLNVPSAKGGPLKWILGLVLIAIIGGGYYFLFYRNNSSPVVAVSSDMSNWKTYENNNFGLRFKYPEELQFKEDSTGKDLQLDSFIINGPDDYKAYLKDSKPNYKITLYGYGSSATLPKHSQEDCNIPETRPDVKRIECAVVNINGSSFVRALDQLNDKANNGSLELTLLGTINSADFIANVHIPSGAKQESYLEIIKNMLGTLEIIPLNTQRVDTSASVPTQTLPQQSTQSKTDTDKQVLSKMSTIRVAAAYYWDKYQNFGKEVSGKAGCTATGSMFTDSIFTGHASVNASTYPSGTSLVCNVSSNGQAYAVQANLATSGYWCFDDVGHSQAETNELGNRTECQ